MKRLIITSTEIEQKPHLLELLDPDQITPSTRGSFYVITQQHPNLSAILLCLDRAEWWDNLPDDTTQTVRTFI